MNVFFAYPPSNQHQHLHTTRASTEYDACDVTGHKVRTSFLDVERRVDERLAEADGAERRARLLDARDVIDRDAGRLD